MKLRIHALLIDIRGVDGRHYGTRINFAPGLNVLRAGNTSGKSTCINAIAYALGMDHAFGPRGGPPLPDSLRTSLEIGDMNVDVATSDVWLELQNRHGQIVTVRRGVKGPRNEQLVTVWQGPVLTASASEAEGLDYFVRIEGAAQRERGFHAFLAHFIGYELPEVIKTDGTPTRLYLECLLPLFFVEQQSGWAGLLNRMPFHFRIKELPQRAVEFILALDTYESTLRRQSLEAERAKIAQEWRQAHAQLKEIARRAGGVLEGVPVAPLRDWTEEASVIKIASGDEWYILEPFIEHAQGLLAEMKSQPVPIAAASAPDLQGELEQTREQLRQVEASARVLMDEVQIEENSLRALDARSRTLAADLKKYEDEKRLLSFGSLAGLRVTHGQCPTCEQPVTPALFSQIEAIQPMPVEQNITFIRDQIESIASVRQGIRRGLEAKEQSFRAFEDAASDLRTRLRTIKDTMTSPSQTPSIAAIQERVSLELKLREAEKAAEAAYGLRQRLGELSRMWEANETARAALPAERFTEADVEKITAFQRVFVAQLRDYEFKTYPPETMGISPETFRPTHEGYEIGYLSASDAIRTIWAYLHGLLETDREVDTNHPGLLILDEPRQQATEMVSFAGLLKRASTSAKFDQQVIAATSEDAHLIEAALERVPHTYITFEGKIFKSLE